jgi:stearoyl-CoA desaturase (delta-9 desaturase)
MNYDTRANREMISTILLGYVVYMLTAWIGITQGYHRYFSHTQYQTNTIIETVMLYCGLLCGVRSPLTWAGVHRMHHAYSDTPKDPHSPKHMGKWRVFFSMYRVKSIPRKFIKDLLKNPRVMFFHRHGKTIWLAHVVITYFIFGSIAIWINFLIVAYSYIGYGVLNTFGHDLKGPVNKIWINLIAPFEGQHRDHHERSHIKS